MTIRKKRNVLIFMVFPIGASLFGYLSSYHWIFTFLFFAFSYSIGKMTSMMKCPRCGTPIGHNEIVFFGLKIETNYSPFTKRKCFKCGYRFDHEHDK